MTLVGSVKAMKKYYAFGYAHVATLREYRADFLGALLKLPVEAVIVVLLWRTVYTFTGPLGAFSLQEMIAYQLLVSALVRGTWTVGTVNYRVWQDIRRGRLDVFLARPADYPLAMLASEVGSIAIWLVLRLVIFEIASVVLHLPILADPLLWVVFALSVAEAFLLNFYIQFMIASLAFWAEAIFGVRDIVLGIKSLLAGQMIPLSLFPASVRVLAAALPFQFTLFVPAAIYLQHYSRPEALRQLGIETLWVAALFILSRLLWERGLRRYESQGG